MKGFPGGFQHKITLTLALCVILLGVLAGAGPAAAQQGSYDCTNPHCYGIALFTHSDLAGLYTAISTVHMEVFCQSNCVLVRNRFLTNEAWLLDTNYYWVEAGMATFHNGTNSRLLYFWAHRRPTYGYFLHHLGEVPDGDIGQTGVYAIKRLDSTTFSIVIYNANTYFARSSKHNKMTPTIIELGQELHGTELVGQDGPATHSMNGFYTSGGAFHYETGLAAVQSDDLPHVAWLVPPTQSSTGGVLQTTCCFVPSSTIAQEVGKPVPAPKGQNQFSTGMPAITPQSEKIPSFSEEDVKQYVETAPLSRDIDESTKDTISAIKWLSAGEVSKLLDDEDMGVPDDTQLCYVELQGMFTFAGPGKTTVTYSKGFEVFDAQTGNLLVSGGLE